MLRGAARRPLALFAAVVACAPVSLASAQAPAPSAKDPRQLLTQTVTERLFDEAVADLDAGKYDSACRKLEDVTALVPDGGGAKATLAECYEKQGKLASAWAQYRGSVANLLSQGQKERAQKMAAQAEALRPRLSMLAVRISDEVKSVPGLSIRRDGVAVPESQWAVAVPVDGGKHEIVISAPGHAVVRRVVELPAESGEGVVQIHQLQPLPDATRNDAEPVKPAGEGPPSFRLIAGIAGLGLGGAAFGAGIVSSLEVASAQSTIHQLGNEHSWNGDLCGERGSTKLPLGARGTAEDACGKAIFGPLQVLFYALGGGLGGAGLYFLLTSGSKPSPPAARWLVPSVGASGASLTYGGSW